MDENMGACADQAAEVGKARLHSLYGSSNRPRLSGDMGMRQRGFIPIGLVLYAAAGLAILASLWAFHHHGVNQGRAEIQTKWDAANKAQRDKEAQQAQAASTNLETGNAKDRIVTRTVTVQVDKIVERPVYRNVCLDPDGLCVARASIHGESADTCKPDKPVSSASRTGGRDWRLRLALDYGSITPLP